MPLGEFELIERFFARAGAQRSDVRLGIGDDGAVLALPADQELVAVVDTLVEGVHFPPDSPPASVGHRALAVNLSDIAAMGAAPAWATLALTLPQVDEAWLAEFTRGFAELARLHAVALVGGDTTRGPLCISVQVLGLVPRGAAITRAGGRPGDFVFASGTLGDAACGLAIAQGRLASGTLAAHGPMDADWLRARFEFPEPRVALGVALRGIASACIDVSDGLYGDLGKLATASGCAAELDLEALPLSPALTLLAGRDHAAQLALVGGDDYELCFCVPAARLEALASAAPPQRFAYRRIGQLQAGQGLRLRRGDSVIEFSSTGFDHFAAVAPR